jgi:hypothetical protein
MRSDRSVVADSLGVGVPFPPVVFPAAATAALLRLM